MEQKSDINRIRGALLHTAHLSILWPEPVHMEGDLDVSGWFGNTLGAVLGLVGLRIMMCLNFV